MTERSMLDRVRVPLRVDARQAGELLGLLEHEIAILIRVKLLRPLGSPAKNGRRFFFAREILELDREWWDRAQRAIERHWRQRNKPSLANSESLPRSARQAA
jgi:hypothetical protein